MRWFTSDLHFGHKNVINYCKRPYKDIEEMHRALVANWNAVVSDMDDVYFLGDWTLDDKPRKYYAFLKKLNFRKLYWIVGNHDKSTKLEAFLRENPAIDKKVQVLACCYITIEGQDFYLIHRPILGRDDMPTLAGHVHEKWKYLPKDSIISEHSKRVGPMPAKVLQQPVLNVGVDQHGWRPISEVEVVEYFKQNKARS